MERIEGILQQHEEVVAAASAVEANEQAFTALSGQLSRMSAHLDLAVPPLLPYQRQLLCSCTMVLNLGQVNPNATKEIRRPASPLW